MGANIFEIAKCLCELRSSSRMVNQPSINWIVTFYSNYPTRYVISCEVMGIQLGMLRWTLSMSPTTLIYLILLISCQVTNLNQNWRACRIQIALHETNQSQQVRSSFYQLLPHQIAMITDVFRHYLNVFSAQSARQNYVP